MFELCAHMRAIVFDRKLEFRAGYPDPVEAVGESVVRVTLAGICGTDLEIARGYMKYHGVPGHEFVGRVAATSNPALRGRRVVGEINSGCGRCASCAAGFERHCPDRTVLGILGRDRDKRERIVERFGGETVGRFEARVGYQVVGSQDF